jgi:hypothetical protein
MLSIIPKEILANLPEIYKLLNLGKNYSIKAKKKGPRQKGEIELPISST